MRGIKFGVYRKYCPPVAIADRARFVKDLCSYIAIAAG